MNSNQPTLEFPPGPSSIIAGKFFRDFMKDPIRMLTGIAQKYGDISHFKLGRQHIYLISEPKYIENILIRDHSNFIKSKRLQLSKRLLGEGLLTSEGEFHECQRRIIQPAFHPNRIKNYGAIMTDLVEKMMHSWSDGSKLDIHKQMMHVTSAIISKSVLGSDIGDAESDKVNDALVSSMKYLDRIQMPFGGLIQKIPILPVNQDFVKAKRYLDTLVFRMISEHKTTAGKAERSDDLLYALIEAQAQGVTSKSDRQIRDEVMTIFLAGHETTANALTWTFYLLSQHPVVDSALYSELKTVLGENAGEIRVPTIQDLPKLRYTENVFRESMRLYPPAWTIARQVLNDYKIGDYLIPARSIVVMSQYILHHSSRYFSDPESFFPERWTDKLKSTLPRFSYFPFGGGIRGCVGEPFAWTEGILLLATICRKWKMQHDPSHKVDWLPLITLRPKYGMLMRIESRK